MEMMVVVLGNFVPVCFAGKGDDLNQAISDQAFHVSINRGQTQVGHGLLCFCQ